MGIHDLLLADSTVLTVPVFFWSAEPMHPGRAASAMIAPASSARRQKCTAFGAISRDQHRVTAGLEYT